MDLIHPPLLEALAAAGHGSLILIADANFPASTKRGPHARLVHLNLRPGLIDAVEILRCVGGLVPIEEALVMAPLREGPYAMSGAPAIWAEFGEVLLAAGASSELQPLVVADFYAAASGADVALTIVSGEARPYGNVLLRIGVVAQDPQTQVSGAS
jgi:L-fucose mutarotase